MFPNDKWVMSQISGGWSKIRAGVVYVSGGGGGNLIHAERYKGHP